MSKAAHPIAYLTDVEGIWEKLASFTRDNPHVSLDAQGRLHVAPGSTFVFGGDAVDRGPHGRRVVEALLDVKRRQPGQVVLLAGNRDINKLRLARELRGHPLSRTPPEVARGPAPALLRWIFENSMGARGAFDFRRAELEALAGRASDEDVVQSFLEDVDEGGPLRAYLSEARLAWRIGNTLFVHGGVGEESLGILPTGERREGVDAWVEGLNAWYQDQLHAFAEGRFEGERPAWEPLIAYQAPRPGTRTNPGSVVYGRMADDANHPMLPSRDVLEQLARSGVYRLVVGHTPSGDVPALLREDGFEIIAADNSYGRVDTASHVYLREDSVWVDARVKLDDGTLERVHYCLRLGQDAGPLGRQLADSGHLVKGPLDGGGFHLFRALPRFGIEQLSLSGDALGARPLGVPRGGVPPEHG